MIRILLKNIPELGRLLVEEQPLVLLEFSFLVVNTAKHVETIVSVMKVTS